MTRQPVHRLPGLAAVLVALCLAAPSLDALVDKEARDQLDLLAFAAPELRLVEVPAAAESISDQVPNMAAIEVFRAEHGPHWRVILDRRRGVPTLVSGGAIPFIPGPANGLTWDGVDCRDASCIPMERVEALARDFLERYDEIFKVSAADLVLDPDGSGAFGASIFFVRLQWRQGGVPVEGATVFFRINGGNLIQVASENIGPIAVNPVPSISVEEARDTLEDFLGPFAAADDKLLDKGSLLIIPITPRGQDTESFDGAIGTGIDYRLVYRVAFHRPGVVGTWEALIDAHDGEILRFVDANRYGRIHGGAYPRDNHEGEADRPFPFADTGLPAPHEYADVGGLFPGDDATTTLIGKYTWVYDECGAISNTTTTGDVDFSLGPGIDCDVPDPNNGGPGNTHSSRTQYYHLTMVNIKARTYMPDNTWLNNDHMNVRVNQSPWCNATSGGGWLNFYKADSGCWNLGEIPGVALHEWGHSMDDFDGSGGDSKPVETRADWTAVLQTHDSCLGRGFFLTGNCSGYGDACLDCNGVRDGDWDMHASHTPWTPANHGSFYNCSGGSYYGPCGWGDHCESGISTQALWDMVTRDLAAQGLDLTTAWMLVDRLFYSSMPTLGNMYTCTPPNSNGCNGSSLYNVFRALDDDGDGTANGTPHAASIFAALDRHNIACGLATDPENQNQTTCPTLAAPTVSGVGENSSAVLTWDAVVDATRYLVYRNDIGCDAGFVKVGEVAAPDTTFTDTSVANFIEYYYRVQAATDNDACTSPMSNCEPVIPVPCQTAAAPTTLVAIPDGDNRISLSWASDDPIADTFNVYRAIGTCPQPAYELAASGITATTWADDPISGGVTYAYVVTAVDVTGGCESVVSNCSEAQTTGACTQAPSFAGVESVTNPEAAICTLSLAWSEASAHCGGPLAYSVYRSTDPEFIPDASNRIVEGITATGLDDMGGLVTGTRYFYVVHAVDVANGSEEGNLVRMASRPTGPGGGLQTLLEEHFEGAWPPAGWSVVDNQGNGHVWTRSDLIGATNRTTGVGGSGLSAAADPDSSVNGVAWDTELWSPAIDLTMAAAATLTYASNFQDYAGNGDIWLDVSIDGGTTWTNLRFQSTDDPSGGTFETEDLTPFLGETVHLRWRYKVTATTAWYWHIDAVTVTADVFTSCVTGSSCPNNPFVDVTPNGPLTLCTGTSQELSAGLTGGSAPFTYQWTEDGADIGGADQATYFANAAGTHSYNCNVRGDGCPDDVFDPAFVEITWQQHPIFAGLAAVTNQQDAMCTLLLEWDAATPVCGGPVTYNVYRSETPGFTPAPDNLLVDGVTATSHSDHAALVSGTAYHYVVRAVDGTSGFEDPNLVELAGTPSGPGSGTQTLLDEAFEGPWPPADWQVIDNIGQGRVWNRSDLIGAINRTTGVGGSGSSAAADPDASVNGVAWDTELWSPTVDLVLAVSATLTYPSNFQDYAGNGDIWLDVSTDGGTSWTNLRFQSTDDPSGGTFETEDLTPFIGNTVILRWRYACTATTAWYWHIDNVLITADILDPCVTGSPCDNNPLVNVVPDGPLTVCEGDGVLLTASLAGGGAPFLYRWTRDGSDIPGADAATYLAADTGSHAYTCLVQGDGCPDWVLDNDATELTWRAEPYFDGIDSVTDAANETCTLDLAWSPGTPVCAGPVRYNVYRSEVAGFTPDYSNRIAFRLDSLALADSADLVSGTTYNYVVRSVDASNGAEDGNLVELSGSPSGGAGGPCTTLVTVIFHDDFESGSGSAWSDIVP